MTDPSRVPKREWVWGDAGGGRGGVHTFEGQLVWWYQPGGPGGHFADAARGQSFDDFLKDGPPVDVEPAIAREVESVVREGTQPVATEEHSMKFICAVDTATLVVFDPKQFEHRLTEPVDWWCERPVMVEEMNAGRGLFLSLGEDGVYEVDVTKTAPARSLKPVGLLIRVTSGEVFVGAGEDIWDALHDRGGAGRFFRYSPGVYRVSAWCPDVAKKAVGFHLSPVQQFRKNRVGKRGLWLTEDD